jgi:hypothetical protein
MGTKKYVDVKYGDVFVDNDPRSKKRSRTVVITGVEADYVTAAVCLAGLQQGRSVRIRRDRLHDEPRCSNFSRGSVAEQRHEPKRSARDKLVAYIYEYESNTFSAGGWDLTKAEAGAIADELISQIHLGLDGIALADIGTRVRQRARRQREET